MSGPWLLERAGFIKYVKLKFVVFHSVNFVLSGFPILLGQRLYSSACGCNELDRTKTEMDNLIVGGITFLNVNGHH